MANINYRLYHENAPVCENQWPDIYSKPNELTSKKKEYKMIDYLYRADTIDTLQEVKRKGGLICDQPSRMLNDDETNEAEKRGMIIPPDHLRCKPRIYFYKTIDGAIDDQLIETHRLLIRIARRSSVLREDNLYPDGAMKLNIEGVYAICEDYKVGDLVIGSDDIEVYPVREWVKEELFDKWVRIREWDNS